MSDEAKKLVERIMGHPAPAPVAPPRPTVKPMPRPRPAVPRPQPTVPEPWRRREASPAERPKAVGMATGNVYAEAQEFLRINGFEEFVK